VVKRVDLLYEQVASHAADSASKPPNLLNIILPGSRNLSCPVWVEQDMAHIWFPRASPRYARSRFGVELQDFSDWLDNVGYSRDNIEGHLRRLFAALSRRPQVRQPAAWSFAQLQRLFDPYCTSIRQDSGIGELNASIAGSWRAEGGLSSTIRSMLQSGCCAGIRSILPMSVVLLAARPTRIFRPYAIFSMTRCMVPAHSRGSTVPISSDSWRVAVEHLLDRPCNTSVPKRRNQVVPN
jgi:hypothetical protein